MTPIENVAVVGMGALGLLYGSQLTAHLGKDHVGYVVNSERLSRYRANPITVNGTPFDCAFLPAGQAEKPVDMVVFATKATGLEQAIEDAKPYIGSETVLISLLNGISSETMLEAAFPEENVIYCVAQGMDAVREGGELTYTKRGTLCIGIPADHPEKQPALDRAADVLTRCDIPFALDEDIRHRLWSKLMLNVGVNQVVMVCEGTYGTIQVEGEPRDRMIAAMREVMALANLEGINVTEKDIEYYLWLMGTLSPDGMP
ncbi:MAG: ketopantoate reductase family protein, partial [Clostridia bacterium]|nr:ketopantoate reductase family protein [Clostridia bacterium]